MFLLIPVRAWGQPPEVAVPWGPIANFGLPDSYGKTQSLDQWKDARIVVVAFLGVECPLARHYAGRLANLSQQYGDRGVVFVGVMSNRHDTIAEINSFRQRYHVAFPLLKDQANQVADQFGALRTPEVFVLDQQRNVRYRGRIDDQYGVGYIRDKAEQHDLQNALDALLQDREPPVGQTEVVGCLIGRMTQPAADSPVTYRRDVAQVLNRHCVECHRPGEIGPFSMSNYEEVAGWAPTMEEVVRSGRMPPWHAAEGGRALSNTRRMSEAEKELLYQWVAYGAPEGEGPVPTLPEVEVQDWRLPRPPDLVLAMDKRPFQIPATGVIEYQYFVVDPGLQEDTWVRGACVQPGNRAVVHHAIVFVRPPDGYQRPHNDIGWLAAYVPGQTPGVLPEHQARLAPAGSKLVFQMHYTPTGSPEEDLTRVGLLYADPQKVTEQVISLIGINRNFEIPPEAEDFTVELEMPDLPSNGKITALAPHMHLRGKSFRFERQSESGATELLLDVPQYDFNWQHTYVFAEPLPTDGLHARGLVHFDNSEYNLVNPDPTAKVRWGDQTWEEMALAYFVVTVPRDANAAHRGPTEQEVASEASAVADRLLQRFDKNADGILRRSEAPAAFGVFAFDRFDQNNDNVITRDEIEQAARKRLLQDR